MTMKDKERRAEAIKPSTQCWTIVGRKCSISAFFLFYQIQVCFSSISRVGAVEKGFCDNIYSIFVFPHFHIFIFSYLLDFQNNCLVTSTRQRRIQGGLWRLSPPPYGFQGGIVPKLVLSPIKRKNVILVCTHFWIRPWTPKTKIRSSKNKIHFCKSSLLKFCMKKWIKEGGWRKGLRHLCFQAVSLRISLYFRNI